MCLAWPCKNAPESARTGVWGVAVASRPAFPPPFCLKCQTICPFLSFTIFTSQGKTVTLSLSLSGSYLKLRFAWVGKAFVGTKVQILWFAGLLGIWGCRFAGFMTEWELMASLRLIRDMMWVHAKQQLYSQFTRYFLLRLYLFTVKLSMLSHSFFFFLFEQQCYLILCAPSSVQIFGWIWWVFIFFPLLFEFLLSDLTFRLFGVIILANGLCFTLIIFLESNLIYCRDGNELKGVSGYLFSLNAIEFCTNM